MTRYFTINVDCDWKHLILQIVNYDRTIIAHDQLVIKPGFSAASESNAWTKNISTSIIPLIFTPLSNAFQL